MVVAAAPFHLPGTGLGLNERWAADQGIYKAEDVGRMVAFTGLALAVAGLLERGPPAPRCWPAAR